MSNLQHQRLQGRQAVLCPLCVQSDNKVANCSIACFPRQSHFCRCRTIISGHIYSCLLRFSSCEDSHDRVDAYFSYSKVFKHSCELLQLEGTICYTNNFSCIKTKQQGRSILSKDAFHRHSCAHYDLKCSCFFA